MRCVRSYVGLYYADFLVSSNLPAEVAHQKALALHHTLSKKKIAHAVESSAILLQHWHSFITSPTYSSELLPPRDGAPYALAVLELTYCCARGMRAYFSRQYGAALVEFTASAKVAPGVSTHPLLQVHTFFYACSLLACCTVGTLSYGEGADSVTLTLPSDYNAQQLQTNLALADTCIQQLDSWARFAVRTYTQHTLWQQTRGSVRLLIWCMYVSAGVLLRMRCVLLGAAACQLPSQGRISAG